MYSLWTNRGQWRIIIRKWWKLGRGRLAQLVYMDVSTSYYVLCVEHYGIGELWQDDFYHQRKSLDPNCVLLALLTASSIGCIVACVNRSLQRVSSPSDGNSNKLIMFRPCRCFVFFWCIVLLVNRGKLSIINFFNNLGLMILLWVNWKRQTTVLDEKWKFK